MSETDHTEPQFGTFALPRLLASLRRFANNRGASYLDKRIASVVRKILYMTTRAPYDVPVFGNQKVRLYPKSNRCEKRAFVGLSSWDDGERACIAADIARQSNDHPFVFLDCGANIGLYSLFARDEALAAGKAFCGLAIEPDPVNQRRLAFNLEASGADDIEVAPFAIGRETAMVQFVSAVKNRGEAHVVRSQEKAEDASLISVEMKPLLDLVNARGLDHIDVMKIDIEGHELHALEPFFESAPKHLWPRKILIEVGRSQKTDAMDLCLSKGYSVERAININAYLTLEAQPTRAASIESGK